MSIGATQPNKEQSDGETSHVQVAQFSAEKERYAPAIEIYEDVAVRSMDNNLLKFSAKGYLLNAGICRLCGESLQAVRQVSKQEDSG